MLPDGALVGGEPLRSVEYLRVVHGHEVTGSRGGWVMGSRGHGHLVHGHLARPRLGVERDAARVDLNEALEDDVFLEAEGRPHLP